MSTKTSIEFNLKSKFVQLLANRIDFVDRNPIPGDTGLVIHFIVNAINNTPLYGISLIAQISTIKTFTIVNVSEYSVPKNKLTSEPISLSEFQINKADFAFDQISSQLYQQLREWLLNDGLNNEDVINAPIFYYGGVTFNGTIYESGSSGTAGTSGSSGSSGTAGTSGSSGSSGTSVTRNDIISNVSNGSAGDSFINSDSINYDITDKKIQSQNVINDSIVDDVPKNSISDSTDSNREKNKPATLGKGIGGLGGSQPIIIINNYTFSSREIISMELSSTSFLPTISLTIKLETGIFISKHFPKDGDVVNVFIRSYNDVFKPIRNDYLITHIDTTGSKDKEGSQITLFIDGILNINYLFSEKCKSIKDKTSFEALLEISKDLKLGFASNETSTDDKMTWICPYDTYKNWIDNITMHAYKDNKSFFDSWVDFYYCFNFLNMNTVYSVSDAADSVDGVMSSVHQSDHNADDNITHQKTQHHFSNAPTMEKTNYYYNSFEFINNSGEINIMNGYKRYVHFYDVTRRDIYSGKKEKHDVLFIDPYSTDKVEEYKHMMKGRANENYYKETNKRKWQGLQYSNVGGHNVHAYWKYAEFVNFQNLEFVDKMLLKINLPKPNYNIYRGQRLPLTCIITQDVERGKIAGSVGKDDYKSLGMTVDRFLSANNYVIVGIKIIYTQIDDGNHDVFGKIEQELYLSRREWEMPTSEWKNDNFQQNSL